jgi:hypothetical protein
VNLRPILGTVLACAALGLAACGGDDDAAETEAQAPSETATAPANADSGDHHDVAEDEPDPGDEEADDQAGDPAEDPGDEPTDSGPSAEERRERAVMRTVRAYIDALTEHDGARVCSLFAPGALDSFEPPVTRGGCASSLSASIGYRHPRGIPWRDTRIREFGDISAPSPSEARATVNVITHFAGDREPSIEDDVIYLERGGGGWRIVKPSTTLYRAVGIAAIPLDAIRPP